METSPEIEDQKRRMTATSSWLKTIGQDLAGPLMAGARRLSVRKGASLYGLQDDDRSLFGVCEGAIGVQVDDRSSGVLLAHVFGPGSWFGEAAVITGMPRQIGTVALTESSVFKITRDYLMFMEDNVGEVWRALGVLSAFNSAVAIQVARDLMLSDSKVRCWSTLSRLADAFEPTRTIPMTHTQLAEICRMSRSGFARVLDEFEAEGRVSREYGRLVIIRT